MVFSYDVLYQAWKDTVTMCSEEPNRVRFRYMLEDNLIRLSDDVDGKTFKPAPLRNKKIIYPKRRIAQVPSLRDKVIQHAMYDNGLYAMLTKPLVTETSACIVQRGDDYASKRMKQMMVKYRNRYGTEFYCLKCDIHSYFASIPHERIYELIDRYVTDEDYKWIMSRFIEQSPNGLALGLPQSQALANLFLSELDHFCKEKLRAEFYARHMDDFCIISSSYEFLKNCWEKIEEYVTKIGLEMNEKTCIYKNKVEFLGFRYFYGKNKRIVMRLLPQKRNAKRRELKKKLKDVAEGRMTAQAFGHSYGGWRAHALRGDCWSLVSAWDKWLTGELEKLGYKMVIKKRRVDVYE